MIIGIMVVGLTSWIVTPAIGNSLESGLSNYANTTGTYVIVDFNGNPLSQQTTLPQNVIDGISKTPGVQTVYPIDVNFSTFHFPNYSQPPPPGGGVSIKGANQDVQSAVIGGPYGFPPSLIGLTEGSLPNGDEPDFVVNSPLLLNMNNQGHPFDLGENASVSIGGINFTAYVAGINAYNPLIGDSVLALWNPAFVQSILGEKLYSQTFEVGANLLIVKVVSVGQVAGVVSSVTNSLSAYPDYLVTYDQATVNNLVSVETGTAPLYQLIGVVALGSSVAAVFFVSYVAIKKRDWETGLLISQGWTWARVTSFFWEYFLLLATIAYVFSIIISFLISQYTIFGYQVLGATLQIRLSFGWLDLASAAAIAISVTTAVAFFLRWRLKKTGLDGILREY